MGRMGQVLHVDRCRRGASRNNQGEEMISAKSELRSLLMKEIGNRSDRLTPAKMLIFTERAKKLGLTPDQAAEILKASKRKRAAEVDESPISIGHDWICRVDLAEKLGVSKTALYNWTKLGIIRGKLVGNRNDNVHRPTNYGVYYPPKEAKWAGAVRRYLNAGFSLKDVARFRETPLTKEQINRLIDIELDIQSVSAKRIEKLEKLLEGENENHDLHEASLPAMHSDENSDGQTWA